jgi:hypothetical protein
LDLGRQPAAGRVGVAAEGAFGDAGADLVAQAPSGERTQLGGRTGMRSLALREHGFYEVRPLAGPAGSGRAIAVNVDAGEADLSHMDPAELTAAVSRQGTTAQAAAPAEVTPEEAEQRQTLWWYLLAAAVILLAAETVWANRLSLRT